MRMTLDNVPPIKRLKPIISMESAVTNPSKNSDNFTRSDSHQNEEQIDCDARERQSDIYSNDLSDA